MLLGNKNLEDSFYKISDSVIVTHISKNACSTVALQALKYNNDPIFNENIIKEFQYKHLKYCKEPIFNRLYNYKFDFNNYNGEKVIFIYRDPVDRLISAWRTVSPEVPITSENLDKLLNKLQYISYRNLIVDQHYAPQISHIKNHLDKINIKLNIKQYNDFCYINNIDSFIVNKNIDDTYLNFKPNDEQIKIIHELYKDDYNLMFCE